MKYFTRELHQFNREMSPIPRLVWKEAMQTYRAHYLAIEAHLPLGVREFAKFSLHDARLTAYHLSDDGTLTLEIDAHGGYIKAGLYRLTFTGVRSTSGLDKAVGQHWIYDEIDIYQEAAFELCVLFDDGEISIAANDMTLEQVGDATTRVLPRRGAYLNLVVIRSEDIDKSVAFYNLIGRRFTKHRHCDGPEHYASDNHSAVFEIYPKTEKSGSTRATRLGFGVDDVDLVVDRLAAEGYTVVSPPADSEWGRRAVVRDPDGHKVELTGAS